MSDLALDSRAILQYLNELGYLNISAEQLREFLKGMQPQPDISKKQKISTEGTNRPQYLRVSSSLSYKQVKVIKSKRPLCHFNFYLDICDYQLTKRIEEQIKLLGGNLEFFLSENVTHFITDKTVTPSLVGDFDTTCKNTNSSNNGHPNTPLTPTTPNTPQTPLEPSNDARFSNTATPIGTAQRKTRQSRADAILNRARHQSSNVSSSSAPVNSNIKPLVGRSSVSTLLTTGSAQPYKIWKTEHALNFFRKIHIELGDYLDKSRSFNRSSNNKGNVISLKGNFLKIEALKRSYRPYYHLFKKTEDWPKVDLSSDEGAFRFKPRLKPALISADIAAKQQVMTRKSRTRTSQQHNQSIAAGSASLPPLTAAQKKTLLERKNSNANTAAATNITTHQCKEAKESSDKQCGVCEICKIEYDTLTVHLKTKDHEFYAKNPENFIALDTLIQSTADLNKFLSEENILHNDGIKATVPATELEEMEVDDSLCIVEDNLNDPLEDEDIFAPTTRSNSAESSKRRPSPALREKSKRTTKGKHSSEKFLSKATISAKTSPAKISPTKTPVSITPKKKIGSASMVELQRYDSVSASTSTVTRQKGNINAFALSPPIRAMLPPSSLYKVVESPSVSATPIRNRRGAHCTEAAPTAGASPSIIVKFQKVRQNELQRLNGEAENFMFPKVRRTSSELPTDIDRQTTSDRACASMSSTSLESTSEPEFTDQAMKSNRSARKGVRKILVAKRLCKDVSSLALEPISKLSTRSNSSTNRKRFQSAPIQPKVQLNSVANTMSSTGSLIILPEATRKSSRTATAIVTKATASSRLLRAQVEAAKQTNRQKNGTKISPADATLAVIDPRRHTVARVVKMEDRMGERILKSNAKSKLECKKADDSGNDYDDDEIQCTDDDEKDEDYVAGNSLRKHSILNSSTVTNSLRMESREERAARRLARLNDFKTSINETPIAYSKDNSNPVTLPPKNRKTKASKQKHGDSSKSNCTSSRKVMQPQHRQLASNIFDCSSSEILSKMRYSFESLPVTDIWHQVYTRQDNGNEKFYTYFGQNVYRKLPYELGPIPYEMSIKSDCYCTLCNKSNISTASDRIEKESKFKEELLSTQVKLEKETKTITYKHKKLLLLQRYQQEQQALVMKQNYEKHTDQQQEVNKMEVIKPTLSPLLDTQSTAIIQKCDSKASTPELLEREFAPLIDLMGVTGSGDRVRADSTHSNTSSSCASSTASLSKKLHYRNKHLNRITELPPRKSPREHASTLALVSCIIRQRQDSLSKTNSDIDEPPTSSMRMIHTLTNPEGTKVLEDFPNLPKQENERVPDTATLQDIQASREQRSPVTPIVVGTSRTRSAAATPVEEMRFATEISETVKRMRRGQNKYDHSPTVVHNTGRSARGQRTSQSVPLASSTKNVNTFSRRQALDAQSELTTNISIDKRKRRGNTYVCGRPPKQHRNAYDNTKAQISNASSFSSSTHGVRKIGKKKGVFEFEIDESALKRLEFSSQYKNPNFEVWLIDKYMELAGKEYNNDCVVQSDMPSVMKAAEVQNEFERSEISGDFTPPHTDCFTSDFDLYDLLTAQGNNAECNNDDERQIPQTISRRNSFCFYSSTTSLQNYYRKRKSLKLNRTGWPKVQKRKTSARQKQFFDEKINFEKMGIGADRLQIKLEPLSTGDDADGKEGDVDFTKKLVQKDQTAKNCDGDELKDDVGGKEVDDDGVITPPASDDDGDVEKDDNACMDECDHSVTRNPLFLEDETVGDSVELDEQCAYIDATDADIEENDDDDVDQFDNDANDVDIFADAHTIKIKKVVEEECTKQKLTTSLSSIEAKDGEKKKSDNSQKHNLLASLLRTKSCIVPNILSATLTPTSASTTASQTIRKHLQSRTPQFNSSLGSCISPSEKLGDNSDIFTVSSDGLDTDLDLSNSHVRTETDDGSLPVCSHQTPKHLRKLIKNDERLMQTEHSTYFDELCKRKTASYRSKLNLQHASDNKINGNGSGQSCLFQKKKLGVLKESVSQIKTKRMPGGNAFSELTRTFREKLLLDNKGIMTYENCKQSNGTKDIFFQSSISQSSGESAQRGIGKIQSGLRHNSKNVCGAAETAKDKKALPQSFIIPRQCVRQRKTSGTDPVELYHYYKREWEHFRYQIPGENSHTQLRWQIRNKLLNTK